MLGINGNQKSVLDPLLFPFFEGPLPIPPQNLTLQSHQDFASGPTILGTCANLSISYVSVNPAVALSLQHLPIQSAQQES